METDNLKKQLEVLRVTRPKYTSVTEWAKYLGISRRMYSLWLSGKRELGKDSLRKIQTRFPLLVSDQMIWKARGRGRGKQNQ